MQVTNMMDSLENHYRPFHYLRLNFAASVSSIENLDGSYPRERKRIVRKYCIICIE